MLIVEAEAYPGQVQMAVCFCFFCFFFPSVISHS